MGKILLVMSHPLDGFEAVRAFHHAPSEVAALGNEIHFFPAVLPNVAAKQVSAAALERESPGIAQAVGPDLGQPGAAHKRIVPPGWRTAAQAKTEDRRRCAGSCRAGR